MYNAILQILIDLILLNRNSNYDLAVNVADLHFHESVYLPI